MHRVSAIAASDDNADQLRLGGSWTRSRRARHAMVEPVASALCAAFGKNAIWLFLRLGPTKKKICGKSRDFPRADVKNMDLNNAK